MSTRRMVTCKTETRETRVILSAKKTARNTWLTVVNKGKEPVTHSRRDLELEPEHLRELKGFCIARDAELVASNHLPPEPNPALGLLDELVKYCPTTYIEQSDTYRCCKCDGEADYPNQIVHRDDCLITRAREMVEGHKPFRMADLRGIAPDCTGDKSSEDFVAELRDEDVKP